MKLWLKTIYLLKIKKSRSCASGVNLGTEFQKEYSIFDKKCQDRKRGEGKRTAGKIFLFLICVFGFWLLAVCSGSEDR